MIIRRLIQGIKTQNWFVVGLDLSVVIVGVFVGVYMSEISSDRALQRDVQEAVNVVKSQLQSDLKNIDEIIIYRTEKLEQSRQALNILAQEKFDKKEFTIAISNVGSRVFTFFPNNSGYSSIKDLGYISKINDPELQGKMVNLFDRTYVRHTILADESDSVVFEYEKDFVRTYWSIVDHGFIGDEKIARARLKNAIAIGLSTSEWYVSSLQNYVRPRIVSVLDAIEKYQESKK